MSTTKSIVISCAGIGSRLGIGKTKALLELEGKTLIRWQLELLTEIEDIRIVIGYQANEVVKEVLKIRNDIIFVYNHNYFNTKTGTSFYLGSKDANENVIEWDGDLLIHPDDVKKIINIDSEFIGYSDIVSDEAVFVKVDTEGNVVEFSREKGDYEWTGPACLKRTKIAYTNGNVYEQISPHLPIKGIKVRAYDIDTYDDYKRVISIIKKWL